MAVAPTSGAAGGMDREAGAALAPYGAIKVRQTRKGCIQEMFGCEARVERQEIRSWGFCLSRDPVVGLLAFSPAFATRCPSLLPCSFICFVLPRFASAALPLRSIRGIAALTPVRA